MVIVVRIPIRLGDFTIQLGLVRQLKACKKFLLIVTGNIRTASSVARTTERQNTWSLLEWREQTPRESE